MKDRNFLAELLLKPQAQAAPVGQVLPVGGMTPQQTQLATPIKLTPKSVLDNRQALANSLLEQARDRSVHPIARGIAAYFGTKQSQDINRERTATEEALAAKADAEKAREIEMENKLFGLKESELDIARKELGIKENEAKTGAEVKRLQAQKLQKEIENLGSGGVDPKEAFDRAKDLRNEFTKNSGEFIKQRDAFSRIQSVKEQVDKDPESAGVADIALIFNFMKVQDPGSTVREGEFATAENSGGVLPKYRNYYNKVLSGDRLTNKQRDDFVNTSRNIFESSEKQHNQLISQYTGLAERAGVKKEDVLVDLGLIEKPTLNTSFKTADEVEKANLPEGTIVTVGGKKFRVEK